MNGYPRDQFLFSFANVVDFRMALQTLEQMKNVQYEAYSSHDVVSPLKRDGINRVKFFAGLGAAGGLGLAIFGQWYANVIDAPINIAGKPLNSWPAFIPICFVFTVLCTGLSAFATFLFSAKLPEPYHAVFQSESFNLSTNSYSILVMNAEDLTPFIRDLKPLKWERFTP